MTRKSTVWLAIFLAGALAGCVQTTEQLQGEMVAPVVKAEERPGYPAGILDVSVTNRDYENSFYVTKSDFHLLNKTNTITDQYELSGSFPSITKLLPGETVEGSIHFDSCGCNGPYTLVYDGPTGILRIRLPYQVT